MSDYVLGFIIGLVGSIAIALITFFLVRKKTGGPKFDERQMVGRGKAFQAGFFTLLVAGAAVSLAEYAELLPGSVFVWHIAALFLGTAVFALTAIHFDAYVSMTDSPKRFYTIGACFTVSMTCLSIIRLTGGEETDRPHGWISLMLAVMWVLIIAALYLHNRAGVEDAE